MNTDIMMGEELNMGKDKPRLAGILYGSYTHQQQGVMKSIPIPTNKKKVPVIYIPNNIGIVIKSSKLNESIPLIDKKLLEQKDVRQNK
jgi:hypothetical protein